MNTTNQILISAAAVYKEHANGRRWLLVKQSAEEGWEIPKTLVRKVESSVRAILRVLGEQGGMTVRVLEEAGRAGGITTVNGRTIPQRHIYYLAKLQTSQGELIGFEDSAWFDYAKAIRKLSSKRERAMLKAARNELREWLKRRKKKLQNNKSS
jgi:ADP-ribose pyrophosphatase YjhB (NUDIX family)